MFEKANPLSASLPGSAQAAGAGRFEPGEPRRAGGALRAVEWSELTARLNAARDLRLLLRTESQAPIESVAASFGDAAASYFALLDDSERGVNHDGLSQSKALHATSEDNVAKRPDRATEGSSVVGEGHAREME